MSDTKQVLKKEIGFHSSPSFPSTLSCSAKVSAFEETAWYIVFDYKWMVPFPQPATVAKDKSCGYSSAADRSDQLTNDSSLLINDVFLKSRGFILTGFDTLGKEKKKFRRKVGWFTEKVSTVWWWPSVNSELVLDWFKEGLLSLQTHLQSLIFFFFLVGKDSIWAAASSSQSWTISFTCLGVIRLPGQKANACSLFRTALS